jgi:hypothetical protein
VFSQINMVQCLFMRSSVGDELGVLGHAESDDPRLARQYGEPTGVVVGYLRGRAVLHHVER